MRPLLIAAAAVIVAACSQAGSADPSSGPWRIPSRQPQIHIEASAGCPATLGHAQDVHNDRSGVDNQLVPKNPESGLICRFGPAHFVANTPTVPLGVLYREFSLDRPTAQRLADVIGRVSTANRHVITSCPEDDGAASIVVFHYSTGSDVDLWLTDAGCLVVDNGIIGALQPGNPSFKDFESMFRQIVGDKP